MTTNSGSTLLRRSCNAPASKEDMRQGDFGALLLLSLPLSFAQADGRRFCCSCYYSCCCDEAITAPCTTRSRQTPACSIVVTNSTRQRQRQCALLSCSLTSTSLLSSKLPRRWGRGDKTGAILIVHVALVVAGRGDSKQHAAEDCWLLLLMMLLFQKGRDTPLM